VRRRTVLTVGVAVGLLFVLSIAVVLTRPLRRRFPLRIPGAAVTPAEGRTGLPALPAERWTDRLVELEGEEAWERLDAELSEVRRAHPARYQRWRLAYLHGRVRQQRGKHDDAADLLKPYLEEPSQFRDLALYHLAAMAEEDNRAQEAAGYRDELIFAHPRSLYRAPAIEEQLAYFARQRNPELFSRFADRLRPQADTALRRLIDAHLVAFLADQRAFPEARQRGILLLQSELSDDAAERVFRALDRPEIVRGASGEELRLLGETARSHRHFDRAVPLLSSARDRLPAKRDELNFSIGRAFFGGEQYEKAEATYLKGAVEAKGPEAKATFYFHASRCAQLLGDDARAEKQMTRAIAVPGKFPATSAALTQRLRTRARQQRWDGAANDLRLLKRLFPRHRAVVEASVSLATARIAAGQMERARKDLEDIPRAVQDAYDRPEIAFWRARTLESTNAGEALQGYLQVLRAEVPTHFAYFARRHLAGPFQQRAAEELTRLRAEVQRAFELNDFELARRLQTDIVLLAPDQSRELQLLRAIYRDVPRYREIVELKPRGFPRFPLRSDATRGDLLFAMGLYDEVIDEVPARYPLQPLDSALTAAYAYHLGGGSRSSMQAVEILVRNVPNDYVPELLPRLILELLYPRYFYQYILQDSEKYDADPVLVLAIMREESRFNPRAKSVAAARGLLQFILTTALQIGRDLGLSDLTSEDLYDPRIVIQLGAKYIGDLMETFEGNRYRAVAAYNAGPHQARLWARLAPAEGEDFYLSAINFEETKHYVRKVMNSYQRYGEIYGGTGAAGGIRAEP
jgi:soluble lytic murein transglycosylase-like protein